TSPLTDLAVAVDGRSLATSHSDHFLRVWDTAGSRVAQTFLAPRSDDVGLTATAFSPDGKWLAAVGGDGALRVWELASAQDVLTRGGSGKAMTAVRFSPDAALIAPAGGGGGVALCSPAGRDAPL